MPSRWPALAQSRSVAVLALSRCPCGACTDAGGCVGTGCPEPAAVPRLILAPNSTPGQALVQRQLLGSLGLLVSQK